MFLKKIFKKEENDQEEILSEEQLIEKRIKLAKSIRFRNTVKRAVLIFLIFVGVCGGYKALFSVRQSNSYDELMDQSFIGDYLENYYQYPQTNQNKDYLNRFSLSDDHYKLEYDSSIESASSSDSVIYNVDVEDRLNNIYSFYVRSNYSIKVKDSETKTHQVCNKVTVAKSGSRYKVVKPVENISDAIGSIQDKKKLDKFEYDADGGSGNVSDKKKAEIENTLSLFLKTYNDNITQARLLVSSPGKLHPLDEDTTLELSNIKKLTEGEDTYYIECNVIQKYKDYLKINMSYHFEIDIKTNKISKMEVY